MLTLVFTAVTANAQELIKNGDFELNPRVEQGTSATTGRDSREGNKRIIIQLIEEQCKPIAETTVRVKGQGWQQFNRQFTASATCTKARLAIIGLGCAKIAIDNVSIKKH